MNNNSTTFKNSYNTDQKWHFINAEGRVLGKLAVEIANILNGKNKAEYLPTTVTGDKVVVTNAEKIVVTGNKMTDKVYNWHTGFPGGLREISLKDLMAKKPTEAVTKAVKGMLPKNRLQAKKLNNLYVYEGGNHPHQAQEAK